MILKWWIKVLLISIKGKNFFLDDEEENKDERIQKMKVNIYI